MATRKIWGFRLIAAGLGALLSLLLLIGLSRLMIAVSPYLNEAAMDSSWTTDFDDDKAKIHHNCLRYYLHPVYGLWVEPNFTMVIEAFSGHNRPGGIYGVRFDADGFRLLPTGTTWRDADIWLCGGSIPWGSGVDYYQSMAGVIERNLDVRVANLAVPGATSVNLVRMLEHLLPQDRPQLLIVMVGVNDACPGTPETDEAWQTQFRLNKWHTDNPGHLFFPGKLLNLTRSWPRWQSSKVPLTDYLQNLERLFRLAEKHRVPLLFGIESNAGLDFMAQPEVDKTFWQHHDRGSEALHDFIKSHPPGTEYNYLWFGGFARYRQAALKLARAYQLPVADMNDGIRKAAGKAGKEIYEFFPEIDTHLPYSRDMIHPIPDGLIAGTEPFLEKLSKIGFPLRKATPPPEKSAFSIPPVRFDLDQVPLEPTENYLSVLITVETNGQAFASREPFYLGSEGKPLPLCPKPILRWRYRIFAHTDDFEKIRSWTWRVSFKARATVVDGKICLTQHDGVNLRFLLRNQPNAFITYVVEDMPLI